MAQDLQDNEMEQSIDMNLQINDSQFQAQDGNLQSKQEIQRTKDYIVNSPPDGISDSSPDNPFVDQSNQLNIRENKMNFDEVINTSDITPSKNGFIIQQITNDQSSSNQYQNNEQIQSDIQEINSQKTSVVESEVKEEEVRNSVPFLISKLQKNIDKQAVKVPEINSLKTSVQQKTEKESIYQATLKSQQLQSHEKSDQNISIEDLKDVKDQMKQLPSQQKYIEQVKEVIKPQINKPVQKLQIMTRANSVIEEKKNKFKSSIEEGQKITDNLDIIAAGLTVVAMEQISQKQTNQLVTQATIERKSQQFIVIKNWEKYRDAILSQHKKLVDGVFDKLERRADISDRSMAQLIKFYQGRSDFEDNCAKFYKDQNKLGVIFKEQDDKINLTYYPGFSKVLSNIDDTNLQQNRNSELLSQFLQVQIKDVFELERENYQKVVRDFKDGQLRYKKKIQDSIHAVQIYYNKYVELYNQTMQLQLKNKKPYKDLYNQEKKYKEVSITKIYQVAHNLMQDQREWGKFIMDNWLMLLQLETQRLQVIQKSLGDLQYQYLSLCGRGQIHEHIQQIILDLRPIDECELFWGFSQVIKPLDQQTIKQVLLAQKLTIEEIRTYFTNVPLNDEDGKHILVLKQFRCCKDVGSIGRTWKEIDLIITVDNNVFIFDEPKKGFYKKVEIHKYHKADLMFSIQGIKLKVHKNEKVDKNMVDITYVQPGIIINSNKKLQLKFQSADEIEELDYFLQTIGQNKFFSMETEVQ